MEDVRVKPIRKRRRIGDRAEVYAVLKDCYMIRLSGRACSLYKVALMVSRVTEAPTNKYTVRENLIALGLYEPWLRKK
jgi:hypothetical protein